MRTTAKEKQETNALIDRKGKQATGVTAHLEKGAVHTDEVDGGLLVVVLPDVVGLVPVPAQAIPTAHISGRVEPVRPSDKAAVSR